MYLDQRTKKFLKVFALVAFVFVLTGCAQNLDQNGKLLADRAINTSTPWSLDSGIFDFILTIPLAKGILFMTDALGNVAWGVVGVTILINILILPIMIKSTVSMQKMQLIQPEMEKIQRKYAGRKDQASQMRQSAEIQALYKKHNISMFGSFSTFLTLPIMLAMWQAVQRIEVLYESSLFGLKLGVTPMSQITSGAWYYLIIVLIVGITQYLAIEINNIMLKRNPRYKVSKQQQSMKTMNIVMTIMIVWFALSMPTAMSLYWITTSLVTVARTIYIQIYHIERKKDK
ncbi:MAG: membrane protein insertase YidC [Coprobacillus sp.]|nr:membrane protein insertase YidC [Coprobacillus sp.]